MRAGEPPAPRPGNTQPPSHANSRRLCGPTGKDASARALSVSRAPGGGAQRPRPHLYTSAGVRMVGSSGPGWPPPQLFFRFRLASSFFSLNFKVVFFPVFIRT